LSRVPFLRHSFSDVRIASVILRIIRSARSLFLAVTVTGAETMRREVLIPPRVRSKHAPAFHSWLSVQCGATVEPNLKVAFDPDTNERPSGPFSRKPTAAPI
jgi:hypothetical protein